MAERYPVIMGEGEVNIVYSKEKSTLQ